MTGDRFDLSTVFAAVATTIPDREAVVWRDRRLSFGELNIRANRLAHHLGSAGLGQHRDRAELAGHESGQDHLAIYLRNGNEYLESMIAGFRARVAPFNVNYRYVDEELLYLFRDADAAAVVYAEEFAPNVARVRDQLPGLTALIQVADGSGHELLQGAIDYDQIMASESQDPPPTTPSPDDLYLLYTGGTTGMPKGVMWRQEDIFLNTMGGRPMGSKEPHTSYDALTQHADNSNGTVRLLLLPPLMHGAAQWASFSVLVGGGTVVIPDDVVRLVPADILHLAERERAVSITVVGDAIARPLVKELETSHYDLSGLVAIGNGGAALTAGVKQRLLAALPHIIVVDAVGSSETGMQMNQAAVAGQEIATARFQPGDDARILDASLTRCLDPAEDDIGWLAQRGHVPLGYLGDAEKTARTFPVIDAIRYSVPGDRARWQPDGQIELLGRDSVTINSGGEKIFAEEVEHALAAHPGVEDVIVVGRPSERWGSEVVAVVQSVDGTTLDDAELLAHCEQHIARYKLPKAFVRCDLIVRSPSGKADYRWARAVALGDSAS